ncbi:MAG: hypothetical protein KTR26_00590, partial [Flammeovirgaceae bacterium]|nr:hypothetical protein [Flammeovirgaceae bacterium]
GKLNLLFGLNGSAILFLFGYLITLQNTPVFHPDHLANLLEKITHYQEVIISEIQEKPNSRKFELQLESIHQHHKTHCVRIRAQSLLLLSEGYTRT